MRDFQLFGHYLNTPLIVLSVFDVFVVGSVLYLAAQDRNVAGEQGALLLLAATGALSVFVTKAAVGLYQRQARVDLRGVLARSAIAFILGLPLMGVIAALSPLPADRLMVALLAGSAAYALLGGLHAMFFAMADAGVLRRKVLVLGAGKQAAWLRRLRRRADQRGFEIVGFVPFGEICADAAPLVRPNLPLVRYALEEGIQEIVVALEERRSQLPLQELQECRFGGVGVVELSSFVERETGRVRTDLIRPGWLVFSGNRIGRGQEIAKRLMDLTFATLLLIFTLPIFIATAIAIKREEGWRAPLLYRQTRIGKNGVPFELLKFRSMRVDAEADGMARWATRNDERVTRVGRFIRKARIDELPQVFNVLTGDMSMVGPRPERPAFVEELEREIRCYGERHRIKPGVTGWAQVTCPYGASKAEADEKLQYDLYYLKNRSLMLDVIILLQTVEVVLFGKGAR